MRFGGAVPSAVISSLLLVAAPGRPSDDPLRAGIRSLAAGHVDDAERQLQTAAGAHPELEDLTLLLRARAGVRGGRPEDAVTLASAIPERFPDSAWAVPALLLVVDVRRRTGSDQELEAYLEGARGRLGPKDPRRAKVTLDLARLARAQDNPERALELAAEVRAGRGPRVARRRARRLADALVAADPLLLVPPDRRLAEAELRLGEGDTTGALALAGTLVAEPVPFDVWEQAAWIRARAERRLGDPAAAEATCLTIASGGGPLAPVALAGAAGWRWNADDDVAARALFERLLTAYPDSRQAPDALYALGRIHQEAGETGPAVAALDAVAERWPTSPLADEARWRAGWTLYLAGDLDGAAQAFRVAGRSRSHGWRLASEYWRARSLEASRPAIARRRFEHLADRHAVSWYGRLARERLGRSVPTGPLVAAPPPAFPDDLPGRQAAAARTLLGLGLTGLARTSLAASKAPADLSLAQAWAALGAPDVALRVARHLPPGSAARRFRYPLAYWDDVQRDAAAAGIDPVLVVSLMRQESGFDRDAVSVADAHGLMQLLPSTATRTARAQGRPVPTVEELHRPGPNLTLGTLELARLLRRYEGSAIDALAAYNAGEVAVTRWRQRYGERPPDEFVELITYRETRDYVKLVLRNEEAYRRLYAASAATSSDGSPPNAPLDMTTITSPGRDEPTR